MATKRAPKNTAVASAASSIPSGPRETGKTAEERHEQRKSWFLAEASKQAPNRAMMARCEAIYDSEHWTTAEVQELTDRGQNPVVYNEVKPVIDWLIGTERRTRVDFYVVSEDDGDAAEEDALNKTKLL